MAEDIRFDGRVAVITGAGNGLGRDYALEIARRGGAVLVNDLGGSGAGVGASRNAADAVVDEIRAAGGKAAANHDSVATRAGGEAIVAAAVEAFGKVDIVISNAGFLRNARFEDIDDDKLDALIDVHLKGAFYVAQPAYRIMRRNGYGRFVFTGSASAMFGHAWQANYAAAKGGLMGLSHIVAIEGSAYGITSNLLMPTAQSRLMAEMDDGFMEIPDFARSVQEADYSAVQDRLLPAFNTPLALYLASERCRTTHGIFSANGGRYAQVLIQATQGWISPAGPEAPSVEDVAGHFDRICDATTLHRPMTVYDEFTAVAAAARERDMTGAPAA
ncbi:short-chain dehydrogenase [Rhizorhabdus wittichii DC-6]|nr:short-chain dehydrogenase [Rhizorhabdus wittichii DC-6]